MGRSAVALVVFGCVCTAIGPLTLAADKPPPPHTKSKTASPDCSIDPNSIGGASEKCPDAKGRVAENPVVEIPKCGAPLGVLAIAAEDKVSSNTEATLKRTIVSSGCFRLLANRGKGFAMAEDERALGSDGSLSQGSNVGKGQIRAADFILQIETARSSNIGAMLGGFTSTLATGGAMNGSASHSTNSVSLSIVDARTTETVAVAESAKKMEPSLAPGLRYVPVDNSQLGDLPEQKASAIQTLRAYANLVASMEKIGFNATSAFAPTKSEVLKHTIQIHIGPNVRSRVVERLQKGSRIYLSGGGTTDWLEIKDEFGNAGWIKRTDFSPTQAIHQ